MPTKPKQDRERERDTGRFAHDNYDLICICGHSLGNHTAAATKNERPCIIGDFGDVVCDCMKFKRARGQK